MTDSCSLSINNVDTVLFDSNEQVVPNLAIVDGTYELTSPTKQTKYVIGTYIIAALPTDQTVTLVFTWDTTLCLPGNYTVVAEVAPVQYETDRANNRMSDGMVTIGLGIVHDVGLISVAVSTSVIYPGWVVGVDVTAVNMGNATENFTVSLYYDTTAVAVQAINNLNPNETATVHFEWNTTGIASLHNYIMKAVASAVPGEINTGNNALADGAVNVRRLGDTDGNDRVNMDDVLNMIRAFGATPKHPRWNIYADFNSDGRIDMSDIIVVLMNFGAS
jgi:hypothetical protein